MEPDLKPKPESSKDGNEKNENMTKSEEEAQSKVKMLERVIKEIKKQLASYK